MGINLATKCRNLLLSLAADMCIAGVRVRSVGVDVSIAPLNTDVHMGANLAPKCRQFLYILAADMCIAEVRMRSAGVDVSIAAGILTFIWG